MKGKVRGGMAINAVHSMSATAGQRVFMRMNNIVGPRFNPKTGLNELRVSGHGFCCSAYLGEFPFLSLGRGACGSE